MFFSKTTIKKFLAFFQANPIYGILDSHRWWRRFADKGSPNPISFPSYNGKMITELEYLKKINHYIYKYIELVHVKQWIERHSFQHVLFFGCSYGHDIYYIAKLFPKITFYGFDIDSDAIKFCNSLNIPNAHFALANLNNRNDISKIINQGPIKQSGIVAMSILTFIYPSNLKFLLQECSRAEVPSLFIKEQTNTSPYRTYNIWKEKRSKYVNRGTWDHPYFTLIDHYGYKICKIELIDQRLRTTTHFHHEPWIIISNHRKNNAIGSNI